ncbi:hypothetical protein CIPAW_09G217900 [Carya illinoinensis]|uniref:Uncharacterized protein n=1 Tax=Carya illinoinensis TaxID=32201 RepID=A0A8T1PGR0_CARIL|nr:hypothetical protein CIPAW_09G217900 [Carya illinoinensis]
MLISNGSNVGPRSSFMCFQWSSRFIRSNLVDNQVSHGTKSRSNFHPYWVPKPNRKLPQTKSIVAIIENAEVGLGIILADDALQKSSSANKNSRGRFWGKP